MRRRYMNAMLVCCCICSSLFVLAGGFISAATAIEWHNWRLPYYTIAAEMDLVSSSPSGMFWDDLTAAPLFDSTLWLWPSADSALRNRWTLEPCVSFGAHAPHEDDSMAVYGQLEVLNDIRYRNILIRQTLHADRRYDDDPFYPAHQGRFVRGRIEEAYVQIDWHYGFLRFGRMLRNWGPFADRSMLLSSNPYSYDAFEWQVHSSMFEFRQMFAAFATNGHFANSADNRPGRFFAAHSLNVMLGKWTTFGVFESFVFRRNNGFPDFQYVNPFSVYTVLDLNREGDGNSMLGFQWKIRPGMENLSFKGQVLLDDIQVDRTTSADKSEPAHWGIDAEVFWRDCLPIAQHHLFKAGYWRTSEWVYTVSDADMAEGQGYTYLEKGLGWPTNDGENLYAGFSMVGRNFWAATGTVAYGCQGQKSVIDRWHDSDSGNIQGVPFDYRSAGFPSGTVQKTIALTLEGMAYYKNYADIRIGFSNRWIKNKNHRASAGFIYAPLFTTEISIHFRDFSVRLPK